jgi:hypothetical protein
MIKTKASKLYKKKNVLRTCCKKKKKICVSRQVEKVRFYEKSTSGISVVKKHSFSIIFKLNFKCMVNTLNVY